MQKIDAFRRTRFFQLCMAHPYAVAFGCGFLALGIATGISTCAVLAHQGMLQGHALRAAASTKLAHGFLRMLLFSLMLCCGVLSAALRPSYLPVGCICLVLKGFALGFALKQLQLDYAWWGILYALLCVVLPSLCTLTGLILCFGYGASRLRVEKKPEKSRAKDEPRELAFCVRLTLFLTFMGILLEGVIAQVLLRVLIA